MFPIYLISLERDSERRTILKRSFPRCYDSFIHINAVNGNELSAREYFRLIIGGSFYPILTPGEVGCALSHMVAFEHFINSGAEYALILEDDVIGNDYCIDSLNDLLAELYNPHKPHKKSNLGDFFLHCGGLDKNRIIFASASEFSHIYKIPDCGHFCLSRTCSYVLTRGVAKKILDKQKDTLHVADDWVYLLKGVNSYYSFIFDHPDDILLMPSGLQSDREAAKKLSSKGLPFLLRIHKIYREAVRLLRQVSALCRGYKPLNTSRLRVRRADGN